MPLFTSLIRTDDSHNYNLTTWFLMPQSFFASWSQTMPRRIPCSHFWNMRFWVFALRISLPLGVNFISLFQNLSYSYAIVTSSHTTELSLHLSYYFSGSPVFPIFQRRVLVLLLFLVVFKKRSNSWACFERYWSI